MRPLQTRWDWYEFTFDDPFDPMVGDITQGGQAGRLAVRLGAHLVRATGRNGYAVAWSAVRGDDELALVYGHSSRAGELHVVVSSTACDEVVPVCRELFREHRVSRADSSADFAGEWDRLDGLALQLAEQRGLRHSMITNSEGGATRYIGGTTSDVRMRVYKKTEQLRAQDPTNDSIPDGIVRVELQVRPGKRVVKERVSRMSPDELWGLSTWSLMFAENLLRVSAERVPTNSRRPSDWTRSRHYLGEQYGPVVARYVAAVGVEAARAEVLAALGLSPE